MRGVDIYIERESVCVCVCVCACVCVRVVSSGITEHRWREKRVRKWAKEEMKEGKTYGYFSTDWDRKSIVVAHSFAHLEGIHPVIGAERILWVRRTNTIPCPNSKHLPALLSGFEDDTICPFAHLLKPFEFFLNDKILLQHLRQHMQR